MTLSAAALREKAREIQQNLDRLELLDWPRWLREADILSRQVTELGRQATALEGDREELA